jgi:hypothetical protein
VPRKKKEKAPASARDAEQTAADAEAMGDD